MNKVMTMLLPFIVCISASAQMDSLLYERDYHIDSLSTGNLAIEIDNATFFQDNEYDSKQVMGYTIPGLWVQPKVTYQPLNNIKLEAGFHSLIYFGKRRYPNTIYQDIATWKGNDYSEGTHILPYFRANVQLGKLRFVVGNIYGGANHHLIDPLYCQELNLTSDPEMGLQAIMDLKRWHLDVWADWQSFIFKGDTHQEAFVFGGNSEVKIGNNLTIPAQVVVQHRGGEIQESSAHVGVQTFINGSVGVRYDTPIPTEWFNRLTAEAHAVLYVQQKGSYLYPDKGWGPYAQLKAFFKYGINLECTYFKNFNYQSLLGMGDYNCTSLDKDRNYINNKVDLYKTSLEYCHSFSKDFAFGARAQLYLYNRKKSDGDDTMDLNFGVFVKCNPLFIIKRFK